MAAGGVVPPPAGYWRKMQAISGNNYILGHRRRSRHRLRPPRCNVRAAKYEIEPDFLVASKPLTSSYFPLSAILFTDAVYQAVADNSAKIGVFAHGFTAAGIRRDGGRAGKPRDHRGARSRRRGAAAGASVPGPARGIRLPLNVGEARGAG